MKCLSIPLVGCKSKQIILQYRMFFRFFNTFGFSVTVRYYSVHHWGLSLSKTGNNR